jgi:Uma2 family endonuclease
MALQHPAVSYAAYARAETESEERHEWRDGIVVAMTGGSPRHGALAARVAEALGIALRGKPSQIFSSDVKVRIRASKLGTYPDLSVVCGPLQVDDDDANSIVNPVLVVEVLSDSTEAYDRGAKFAHYRTLPSLKAVLFVRQRDPGLELFVKRDDGAWELHERQTGSMDLLPLGVGLTVDEIYRAPLPDA